MSAENRITLENTLSALTGVARHDLVKQTDLPPIAPSVFDMDSVLADAALHPAAAALAVRGGKNADILRPELSPPKKVVYTSSNS